MSAETITTLVGFYVFAAIVGSIFVAGELERNLKKRLPATRPYRWGFYCGCMGVACGPFAVLAALGMVVAGLAGDWESFGLWFAYAVWMAAHTVCGWFIIWRKRWAWVLGTVLNFNILVWITNYIYGRNRWGEFIGQAYGSAGTEDEGYKLLNDATKLEAKGRVWEALALYQRIVERYPHTAAGGDAQKSAESLRARLGLACPAPAEISNHRAPLPPPLRNADAGRLDLWQLPNRGRKRH